MALASTLHVGLKEWASVCSALEEGRQIILIRKGGIHESAGRFELENPQFLLFPTYLHQNAKMLKAAEQGRVTLANTEPEQITLSAAGEVTDIIQLKSRQQMDVLDDQHIWTPPLIDMRFNYRPENPLFLLLLRIWRLANPVTVQNTVEYAGCKSWVPLTKPVDTNDVKPPLADVDYDAKRGLIIERLASV